MADLQAEIELTVELRKFFNIDLFVQGYYQIRTGIKFAPRIQAATKVEVKSEFIPSFDDSNDQLYPACVFNDYGVSKTFLIIYKNEEVELDDQFNFKLSVIVDAQNITECFNRMEMQLAVELYFIEKDYAPEKMATMQQLCTRSFKLHFNPRLGLHTHVPILFDYFHLCALTTTVHGSLLCLIPPYVFDRPNVRRTSLFSFLFGQDLSQITTDQLNAELLERAYHLHNNLCEILLSSYESLQDFYEKLIEQMPGNESKPAYEHQKCRQRLKHLSEKLKTIDDIHTIDNLAHAHIAQCSAENIMLWCQFIQIFGLHETPAIILAKEYHFKRVKRLSEGFFHHETSRVDLLTNEGDTFIDLHDLIRNSPYYARLPHLPIECVELDGIPDTLPIIIEEVYSPTEQQQRQSSSTLVSGNTKPKNENVLAQTVQSPSQPGPTANRKANDPVINPTSEKRPVQTFLASSNTSSTFITDLSANTSSPSRLPAPTKIDPVVAFSKEPSVQLTSFRKTDPIQSNTNPSLGLFPNQSDSELSQSVRNQLDQPGLTKQTSSQSLPGVSSQRPHRTSVHLLDSPDLPEFLCSTSKKTEDEVFSTTDQDEVVTASTFGDSSMKSKVLRASYRGKANTMDRRGTITPLRSLSTSSTSSYSKYASNIEPKYFTTQTDEQQNDDQPKTYPLDSVLNLTLQLEQDAIRDIQHRQIHVADRVDPLLLNGLTDEENKLNSMEKSNGDDSSMIIIENTNDQLKQYDENKHDGSLTYDRIQNNSSITSQTIEYVVYKEKMKASIASKHPSNLMFFSDFSTVISPIPYFSQELTRFDSNGIHLIICVHGLDGNSGDLRLMKTYLELCLPTCQLDFLMSSSNHSSTFDDIDIMAKQLIEEVDTHISRYGLKPQRMSFIGHSLGNLVIRAAVSHPRFARYRPILYTYLSLSGPHLGTLFNTSNLVNMGMWLMQRWKKSFSLAQMSFKDHLDPKQTYLYKLSKLPCLEFFKNILLVASTQDRYVPFHSARIEVCKAALKDTVYGSIYVEMINNLLEPILRNPSITFVRYNAFHNIPSGTNNIIGRAAHIAILDSELFVEKLLLVSAAKYFK